MKKVDWVVIATYISVLLGCAVFWYGIYKLVTLIL